MQTEPKKKLRVNRSKKKSRKMKQLEVIQEGPECEENDPDRRFLKKTPKGWNGLNTNTTKGVNESPEKQLLVKMSTEHECPYCLKVFHSKATLDIHSMTKRHDWQLKKAIENLKNVTSYQPFVNGGTETLEGVLNDEGRYSNGSIISSEEGYYSTDSDGQKTPTLPYFINNQDEEPTRSDENNNELNKSTENTRLNGENEKISLETSNGNETNDHEIFKNEVETNDTDDSKLCNGNDVVVDTNDSENDEVPCLRESVNTRTRKSTKERLKRKKMEELKVIYKQYAASRGSNDLYKTLLDTYADFEISPEHELPEGVKINVSAKTNRRYSVSEKESLMRRDLVLTELADTEKSYVDDLCFIVKEYFTLMDQNDVTEELRNNFEKIFGNIEEIYKFHSRIFLEKIEDCLEDPHLLNETFCKYEDELATLYSQYCKCKPYADEVLHLHEVEIDELRRKYMPNEKLSIKDYLVKPVQRLMKYQLLLTTAKKYSEKVTYNSIFIKDAIEVMDRVPKLANDAMHVELIKGYEGFLQSDNLLYQETLEVNIGKENRTKAREMRVFIFDSLVVFCDIIPRKGRLASYKCVGHGQTSLMGITETVENEPLKFAVFFRKFNTTDIYICQATTKNLKEEWLQVLKDVIALQTIILNRASQHSSLEKIDLHRKREGVYRRSSRGKYVNDLVVGETLRQALQGHPRIGEMSERLKINIERYILNELIMASEGDPVYYRKRSQSVVPISSLVTESELKPSCRPRCHSSGEYISHRPPRPPTKERATRAKMTLVQSIASVSFGQLDP